MTHRKPTPNLRDNANLIGAEKQATVNPGNRDGSEEQRGNDGDDYR